MIKRECDLCGDEIIPEKAFVVINCSNQRSVECGYCPSSDGRGYCYTCGIPDMSCCCTAFPFMWQWRYWSEFTRSGLSHFEKLPGYGTRTRENELV